MPRIFDNIDDHLCVALQDTLGLAHRADFCVGYFNLRGWKEIDDKIGAFEGGGDKCCRLLVGMSTAPEHELRKRLSEYRAAPIDQGEAIRIKRSLAESFKKQLCFGIPTDQDEKGLRRLRDQLKDGKLIVKLYTRNTLHAKLYLAYRNDPVNPIIGYVGSSNLTFSGLGKQGELNVDVLDGDAARKLADWFEDRWEDRFCLDITQELIDIIEESWAREELIPAYHIYLRIAYILSQEARTGVAEEILPREFEDALFQFQKEAVKIAAHHLKSRGGVMIGDVVGLGKTITATAVASLFDHWRVLVICPKNLVEMWKDYSHEYGVQMTVVPITQADKLPDMRRHQLVIIDESHNLRNREGKRYGFVQEYIMQNDAKVILLSATPYNKAYLDLASQLRLFVDENQDLGIAPEQLIKEHSELFLQHKQCFPRSLRAFEHSEHVDDWRELMRLFLVRRTRSFIKNNYAKYSSSREQHYLIFFDGSRSYFPKRQPKTLKFEVNEKDPNDQYAQLYSDRVAQPIGDLQLPRYGLGNYVVPSTSEPPTQAESKIIENLSRAGKRLMGFCRTGLFKRLESSGNVFIQSIERHILRNFVFIHALENDLPLPIGSQDVELLDPRVSDTDFDLDLGDNDLPKDPRNPAEFRELAAHSYGVYRNHAENHFSWIGARHFVPDLVSNLENDAKKLIKILKNHASWDPAKDTKLSALEELLKDKHRDEKVLVFTQFADTAHYLAKELQKRGIEKLVAVTGDNENPTRLAHRFSPVSNNKKIPKDKELRVLIATDVLSEGQNLQDAHIIINYDLPWAIIRLIQRAGRVDRIGQNHNEILCYSFLPADGVERIIRLRSRVLQRLDENKEVVGSDEAFFEGQDSKQVLKDLYNEAAGILDGDEDDGEVDLASEAYQIWKDAVDDDPALATIIPALPNVIYSARPWVPKDDLPEGVVVFLKSSSENSALAWIDNDGNSVTESQYRILKAARCNPDTPTLTRAPDHHARVKDGVDLIIRENRTAFGGTLGSPRSVRFRVYEKVKNYLDEIEGELFDTAELRKALQQVYETPLTEKAKILLGQHLKAKSPDLALAEAMQSLYEEDNLCLEKHEEDNREPQLICSLGLRAETEASSEDRDGTD